MLGVAMFLEGDQVGPYVLVRFLGQGQFGAVWLAEKRAFAVTQLALKLPLGDHLDLDAVKKEAAIWAKAGGHPNIVSIFEIGCLSRNRPLACP